MYACPNCAANLRYNIERKKLYCERCETTVNPYSFHKDSEENTAPDYEVTLFTCTQCGGEIISDDTTISTFCSYCGTATILDSRISREKKPSHIIPFSQTMENCKKAYKRLLRRAIFVPKELRDPEHIGKFRGIYMPYWVYTIKKDGITTFYGQTYEQRGDHSVTIHHSIKAHVDASSEGITFDASSTFPDGLSNAIAPFDVSRCMPFNPAFLSGFYADTNDIDQTLYYNDAAVLFMKDCAQSAYENPTLHNLGVRDALTAFSYDKCEGHLALFPVWFLAFRKDDRVAYAVVNGQTGKITADLPISIKRYLFISALLAVIIYILLESFFLLRPRTVLMFTTILATASVYICSAQINALVVKENIEYDKGLLYKRANNPDFIPYNIDDLDESKKRKIVLPRIRISIDSSIKDVLVFYALMAIVAIIGVCLEGSPLSALFDFFLPIAPVLVLSIYSIILVKWHSGERQNLRFRDNWDEKLPVLVVPGLCVIFSIMIAIWRPDYNLIYYIASIMCMLGIAHSQIGMIRRHNRLATHKLPQLNKRGGDENA